MISTEEKILMISIKYSFLAYEKQMKIEHEPRQQGTVTQKIFHCLGGSTELDRYTGIM